MLGLGRQACRICFSGKVSVAQEKSHCIDGIAAVCFFAVRRKLDLSRLLWRLSGDLGSGQFSHFKVRPFDPFPFILLNLILSCLAAIQAPVIMMSQNRQEAKDRLRSQHDYQVNLKAELEIRHLHDKIDHLLSHQWERLAQIQEVQLDVLSELTRQSED